LDDSDLARTSHIGRDIGLLPSCKSIPLLTDKKVYGLVTDAHMNEQLAGVVTRQSIHACQN